MKCDLIEDYFDTADLANILPLMQFHYDSIATSEKFFQYSHPIIIRPEIDALFFENSDVNIMYGKYLPYFLERVNKFCAKHDISYKNILRANVQTTFAASSYPQTDPHIDFTKPNIIILMYLTDISPVSETIIYDFTYPENTEERILLEEINLEDLPIKYRITPKFGKIAAFNGKYYHANKHPLPGEHRTIAVFNLLL